ncbi:MAG TPA: LuxR C-terminal-related transcriptional regulator [Acidimicrobiales bacterium]
MTGAVERARQAFADRRWADAYAVLVAQAAALEADDLERLAVAAHLLGQDDESVRAWEQAYAACARHGDPDRAARCAAWLGLSLLLRGDMARASGWFARAARLLDDVNSDGAARGYLLLPGFLAALGRGDSDTARRVAVEIVGRARRFGDDDLLALGLLSGGQAALAVGDTAHGLTLLDEAMVAVASGEVSPIATGIIYCAVIESCMDALDLRRAAEWTEALDHWCETQPDLVPYRGQCLVHRAQILQAHGKWTDAAIEAERAARRLSDTAHPAVGLAFYEQGELHRLRGERADAERAYRAASEHGREPAPGLALLRLQEGKVDAAVATIRRMVEESQGQLTRPTMLAAAVEILLAAGDEQAARSAADELAQRAEQAGAPLLYAMAAYATGSVLVAAGDATAALALLRRASATWRELEVPYDVARARRQIALACRALGDDDTAALEIEAARATFEQLGAVPDLAEVDGLRPCGPDQLTAREREVLRLVATGRTNRQIAAELVISEHTVGRHLQNIFMKLGLSTRAAATAYAYEHHLV